MCLLYVYIEMIGLYYLLYYFQLYSIVLFSFDAAISAFLLVAYTGKKPCVACFCLCFLFYFYSLITFLTMMFLLAVTFLPVPPFPSPLGCYDTLKMFVLSLGVFILLRLSLLQMCTQVVCVYFQYWCG